MQAVRLHAGVGEVEIAPPAAVELAADLGVRAAKGIATPLMAKALVLSDGAESLALVALDLWGLAPEWSEQIAGLVAERASLRAEAVLLACSHTRGAPCTAFAVGCAGLATEYLREIGPKIAAAVAGAKADLRPASLGVGHADLPHLVYNHRLLTRNMKAISAWMGVPKDEVLAPEGPVDAAFHVLVVRDAQGQPMCLLWHFAADNRFPEGDRTTAGLPHSVQQEVDARIGRHVPCLHLPGCGGDVSYARGLDETADAVASGVMAVQLETSCDPDISLAAASELVVLPVRDYGRFWSEADIALKCPGAVEAFAEEVDALQAEGALAVPTSLRAFRLGRVALVGLPGMPFAQTGLGIRESSPFAVTLTVANSNDGLGPIPTRQAFAHEGFETWPSRAAKVGTGAAEFLAAEAGELLRRVTR